MLFGGRSSAHPSSLPASLEPLGEGTAQSIQHPATHTLSHVATQVGRQGVGEGLSTIAVAYQQQPIGWLLGYAVVSRDECMHGEGEATVEFCRCDAHVPLIK